VDGDAIRIVAEIVLLAMNAITGGALIHERRKGKQTAGELGEAQAATSMLTPRQAQEMVDAAERMQRVVGMLDALERRMEGAEDDIGELRWEKHNLKSRQQAYEFTQEEHHRHIWELRISEGLATNPGLEPPPIRRPLPVDRPPKKQPPRKR
jgi:hypothetical protein